MELTLIRNATLRLNYGNKQFLIDPFLAEMGSLPSFTGRSTNPMSPLPTTSSEAIAGAEITLISHLHADHFDTVAQELLPNEMQLICQPDNEAKIKALGFNDVTPLHSQITVNGITVTRTSGNHGSSEKVLAMMGTVCGFILQADGEPTVYWVGDTVWYAAVAATIAYWKPDIIVTHSCGAVWGDNELIVMDDKQTVELCQAAPKARVIAVHMEALDHSTVSRAQLRQTALDAGLNSSRLLIPADGESISL